MRISSDAWSFAFGFTVVGFIITISIAVMWLLALNEVEAVTEVLYLMRSPIGLFLGLGASMIDD